MASVPIHGIMKIMIRTFRHRGLRRLYERNDPSKVSPDLVNRVALAPADLEDADKPSDVNLPEYRLHPLTGDPEGRWIGQSHLVRLIDGPEGRRCFGLARRGDRKFLCPQRSVTFCSIQLWARLQEYDTDMTGFDTKVTECETDVTGCDTCSRLSPAPFDRLRANVKGLGRRGAVPAMGRTLARSGGCSRLSMRTD